MKSQALRHTTPVYFSGRVQFWNRIGLPILVAVLLSLSCRTLLAQENFLVATQDGTMSLYDLATTSLIESFRSGPLTYTMVAGPNNRVAFSAGGTGYGFAVDTTIQHDVTRLTGVKAPASTLGSDGKYYLAADYNYVLDVVDTATLALVRTVDFSSVIPRSGNPGAITVGGGNAYIFPRNQNSQAPHAAVINLTTFQLSSIAMPAGTFCRRCASRTPDGSLVYVIEIEQSDGKAHVLAISTATNTVIHDFAQSTSYASRAFAVTTSTDPNNLYGYLAKSGSVLAVDLRPSSPTYGQVLANTQVALSNSSTLDVALSSDGSRLILAETPDNAPPMPNVDVIDTAKMLSDPNNAVVARLTVNGGLLADTVCTGFFLTVPPNTAPTVTGVSGDITNDKQNNITITGTNFEAGALVGIGGYPFLPSTFVNSNTLTVTVPEGAPAGKALDIVVTNPQTNDPPDQQNQSGLLAGKFNILPNPSFQPTTQFATDNSVIPYLYDLKQQTMVGIPTGYPADLVEGLAFNVDGKEMYLASVQEFQSGGFYVLPIDLSTRTSGAPIPLPSNTTAVNELQPLVAGLDPQKDTPVIYVAWSDGTDLHLGKIDSDSSSPTYNTIVATFNAGLNTAVTPGTMVLSRDGKYCYLWYYTDRAYLGILNLVTAAFTSVPASMLGVSETQLQIGISPDGKSMLLAAFYGNRTRIRVFDLSSPTNPRNVVVITPTPIPRRGFPQVDNYQVIGDRLYAIDLYGAIVEFNFDRAKGDFRELGYLSSDQQQNYTSYGFSADGSYMYVVDYFGDLVSVLDTSKLISGKNPTLTNIRSPYTPYSFDVSPVAPPTKSTLVKQRTAQRQGGQ